LTVKLLSEPRMLIPHATHRGTEAPRILGFPRCLGASVCRWYQPVTTTDADQPPATG
jgi:hypothetical protein